MEFLNKEFKGSFDFKCRELQLEMGKACVVYLDSIVDANYISDYIIRPLINMELKVADVKNVKFELYSHIVETVNHEIEMIEAVLAGNTIVLLDFCEEILSCSGRKFQVRAIEEPPTETVIKGSREGFNENVTVGCSLIRKRLKDSNLKLESIFVGDKNNQVIVMAYIEGVAPQKIIDYVKKEINNIKNDYVFHQNIIEERLKTKYTAFDTVGYTEKPDILVSKLVEGRVGIIMEGTTFAIFAPYFFVENIIMADDYYLNKYGQNYFRLVRWISALISLTLPGLYVALTTHHFSLIPSIFVFRLAVLRAGVPYPTIVEIVIMMFFFQVLREAGVRLPQAIGPAISIVGALILGDAAIRSGLASNVTVLVVALSAISLFLIQSSMEPYLFGVILF